MRIFIFLLSFLFSVDMVCAESAERKELFWLADTLSSKEFANPDIPHVSTATDTVRLLMLQLKQYEILNQFAQNPAIDRLLKKLPNSCAPNRIKTPKRLKHNLYSLPINIYLELRLYARNQQSGSALSKYFSNKYSPNKKGDQVSLASIFARNPTHILAIDQGRSFGSFLDSQISRLSEDNLIIRAGGARSLSTAYMLFKNRVDYVIDYPAEIKVALDRYNEKIKLDSIKISNSSGYIVGYIACSKSDFGQQVIKDINRELRKLYKTPAFYQAHVRYLDQADMAEFNLAYEQVFQTKIPFKSQLVDEAVLK